MLDFCFVPQREPLDMIEVQLVFIPFVVIEHLTKCHNLITRLDLINPITWFDLISYIIWFDLISSIHLSGLIKSYLLIRCKYFESGFSSCHLSM